MKYYLIAGEASGDLHGAALMEALAQCDSSATFRFWGGELMAAQGGELVRDYRDAAVMGFVEVLRKAGSLRRNLAFCKADIELWRPDAVILIDYPGFNLRIAESASRKGFKVFWYIAPKVWASRERRVRKLRKYVDRLFVILPFEQEYFRKHGIDAVYVGNPLVDAVAGSDTSRDGLPDKPYIALLPGSRKSEISYTMPVFMKLEKLLAEAGLKDFGLVIAAAPSLGDEQYEAYMSGSAAKLVRGQTHSVLKHSAAAVVDSGTASLEAALLGAPQVVVYGMNALTFMLVRLMLKTKYVSLVNIISGRKVVGELLQDNCRADKILEVLRPLLEDSPSRSAMLEDYAKLKEVLGEGGASLRAAQEMATALKSSN